MELKTTQYVVQSGVATLTLARPERMNSWTGRMHAEYRFLLQESERDPSVRATVLTGEGRGFCPGADFEALQSHVERGAYDAGTPADLARPGYGVREEFDADFAFQFGLKKPVVAAINGAAAGVGLVMACYADLRFAARDIKMTTAHGRLNLPAEYGLSWLLPRMIGLTAASDLLLSSRIFSSEEAMTLGLLNGLFESEDLLPQTYAYVKKMIERVSPSSLAATKRQIYVDLHRDVGRSVHESNALLEKMMKEDDYLEAVASFREKRSPRWRGE
ncbi:MAG: enoyl-CoA hydratase-related protein [Myxococcota bacterium]|jgi:enoyl-CoA hydratase/carnithine racemase|nr:enoyl-CoA hydratase-related protein [Myxococcota bacterium]